MPIDPVRLPFDPIRLPQSYPQRQKEQQQLQQEQEMQLKQPRAQAHAQAHAPAHAPAHARLLYAPRPTLAPHTASHLGGGFNEETSIEETSIEETRIEETRMREEARRHAQLIYNSLAAPAPRIAPKAHHTSSTAARRRSSFS